MFHFYLISAAFKQKRDYSAVKSRLPGFARRFLHSSKFINTVNWLTSSSNPSIPKMLLSYCIFMSSFTIFLKGKQRLEQLYLKSPRQPPHSSLSSHPAPPLRHPPPLSPLHPRCQHTKSCQKIMSRSASSPAPANEELVKKLMFMD